jgi:hypothetical protein
MAGENRKRILATLMIATVIAVVGYGTAVAAGVVNLPLGDAENPNASPSPLGSYTLTVEVMGSGYGLVTSDPAGIRCGWKCSVTFPAGTTVTLHAAPGSTSDTRFALPCAGEEHSCSLQMDADKTVSVRFQDESVPVTVSVKGHGSVHTVGSSIHCPGNCAHSFRHGDSVKLLAHAAKGWRFEQWSGACSGKHVCVVHLNGAKHATAHFGRKHR